MLRLVRFPNLVIVALTQYLLMYWVLRPSLLAHGMAPLMDGLHFGLLCLVTCLIAAAGNVINDIVDYPIDIINKPHKTVVSTRISVARAHQIYIAIVLLGLIISLYLAWYIQDITKIWIYALATTLLYCYSYYWKSQVLIGNLVVSFFCAFVSYIVLYAEAENVALLQKTAPQEAILLENIFIGYAIYAFFSTLFREIVKDIEDQEGDASRHCRTLPIVAGVPISKGVAAIAIVLLLMFSSQLIIESFLIHNYIQISILTLFLITPICYALYALWRAESKADFAFLSKLAKAIMLSGIFFIVIKMMD